MSLQGWFRNRGTVIRCAKTTDPIDRCLCPDCYARRSGARIIRPPTPLPPPPPVPAPVTELPDIEIARYGLRTFKLRDGTLGSVVKNHAWTGGTAIAQCLASPGTALGLIEPPHEAPHEDCACGIYATLNFTMLARQYGDDAKRSVAVIAAEGTTIIGDKGLRTAAARIVGWWAVDDDAAKSYAQCDGATRHDDVNALLEAFGFEAYGEWPPPPPPGFRAAVDDLDGTLAKMKIELLGQVTPAGLNAIKQVLGYLSS